jgi:predicted transcriptional regulator
MNFNKMLINSNLIKRIKQIIKEIDLFYEYFSESFVTISGQYKKIQTICERFLRYIKNFDQEL